MPLAVLLLAGATGSGGDSGGATSKQRPMVGEQSYDGFPGAGSPTAPDVSTATCIGC